MRHLMRWREALSAAQLAGSCPVIQELWFWCGISPGVVFNRAGMQLLGWESLAALLNCLVGSIPCLCSLCIIICVMTGLNPGAQTLVLTR